MSAPLENTATQIQSFSQLETQHLVRIFGLLDLKTIGVTTSVCKAFKLAIENSESLWENLFPGIRSIFLPMPNLRDRASMRCSMKIRLEYQEQGAGMQQGVLDLYDKIIRLPDGMLNIPMFCDLLHLAIRRPEVRNGSFIIYPIIPMHMNGICIKDKAGKIVDKVMTEIDKKTKVEFKKYKYQEYKIFFDNKNLLNNIKSISDGLFS